jgi:two-component system chemotaxis response regulator CheB
VDVIAIASSTGGPHALTELLPALPAGLQVPIVIVQHMPAEFTRSLADRLNTISAITVREAIAGEPLKAGLALLAPGDKHMVVERSIDQNMLVTLNQGPPENSCRPAADILFRSVAKCYGENVLAIVLTGMGKDGLAGSRVIRAAGGRVVAQDEASSVVWGMPGEVVHANLADSVLPLKEIATEIIRRVRFGRTS